MARPAKPKKSAASESLLTGRVTRSHGRHHFVQGPDGALYGGVAIEEVLPRTSLLFRSDEWRTKELASNIDLVAIVFASRPTFNPWFIWKALLAATKAGNTITAVTIVFVQGFFGLKTIFSIIQIPYSFTHLRHISRKSQ